jgi:DNA-binding MarR family transcriptional regulator
VIRYDAMMPRATAKRPTKTATKRPTKDATEAATKRAAEIPENDIRWLSSDEEAAWRAIAQVMVKLPWALECQLQRDAGLSFIEYHVLARLSEDPEHTLRMSELAMLANASLSRLSHLVKRLELRGLLRREADPADGRFTNAIMTDAGYELLVASAPGHVARVRSLVVDALSAAELRQLHDASERLLARLEGAS